MSLPTLTGKISTAPARSTVAAIEIADLAKSYGAVRAVAGVSLRVQPGETGSRNRIEAVRAAEAHGWL